MRVFREFSEDVDFKYIPENDCFELPVALLKISISSSSSGLIFTSSMCVLLGQAGFLHAPERSSSIQPRGVLSTFPSGFDD